jgi:predicted ribosome quality control (RQC) complex YloA/Tae2 family protein
MGKHSNLILVDPETGRIIDSLKRITEAVNRYRQVLPGELYQTPPPANKTPLWEEKEDTIAERLISAGASQALDKVVLSSYDGLGPLSVQELIHRAGASPVDTLEYFGQGDYMRLFHAASTLGKDIANGFYQPEILHLDGKPKDFSAIALTLFPKEQRQPFDSLNAMLDTFYRDRGTVNLFRQRQRDLEQILRREQDRRRKKAGLQAESILEGTAAEKWRVYGQLLTANHYLIPQGEEATVTNYFDPDGGSVTIAMDPKYSPMENAQIYFKRYQKARQTAQKAQLFYDETMVELAYLDSISFSLTAAKSLEGLAEIREELAEAGYMKPSSGENRGQGAKSRKNTAKSAAGRDRKGGGGAQGKPRAEGLPISKLHYKGYDILYGSNNRQNDYLNMKIAKGGDLWFHAQNIPSAHVVIRNPDKREIPEEVIETAAKLCLWNSRAKEAGRAAIDFTLRQNIWKPKGAKPGMMLYEQYQTLFVTVSEEEIRRLPDSE